MTTLAGLVLGALVTGATLPPSPIETSVQGRIDVRDQIIPYLDLENADVQEALSTLFKTHNIKSSIGKGVEGKVTISLRNVTVQLALENLLKQVDASYRVEGDVFVIRRKFQETTFNEHGVVHSNFVPGEYSSRYDFSSPVIFETPKRTKGGTCDMLLEAVRAGGFSNWKIWNYGNSGFAIVLPFETIHKDGRCYADNGRFGYKPTYMTNFDFSRIGDYVASEFEVLDQRYRVIVLVAATEPISKDGVGEVAAKSRIESPGVLAKDARIDKWSGELNVSAFVYEFMGGTKILPAQLVPEMKGLSARTHLLSAGLWKDSMLISPSSPVTITPLDVQGEVMEDLIHEVTFDDTDVREALKDLFKAVNDNYSVAPNVQGKVTLHLKNMLLDVVLKTILNQVGAEYREEKQVFVIEKKRKLGASTATGLR